jgi:hypothetical protein
MELSSIEISNKTDDENFKKKEGEKKKESRPLTRKEEKAANRILKFWKRHKSGNNIRKWNNIIQSIRERKNANFAKGILFLETIVALVAILIRLYSGVGLLMFSFAFNSYLTILMWAATLPSKNDSYVKVSILIVGTPLLLLSFLVNIENLSPALWAIFLMFILSLFGAVKLLQAMKLIFKHMYIDGMYGLSSRISSKIIAGMPLLAYLGLSCISAEYVRLHVLDDLCKYMPGARFDANYVQRGTFMKGIWINCTNTEQMEMHWPENLQTVQDVAVEEGMKNYARNNLHWLAGFLEMTECSLIFISSQTLLRICRLTTYDILSMRVSVWEMALSVFTVLRLMAIGLLSSLNLETFTYSNYITIYQILVAAIGVFIMITIIVIIKLVYEAHIVAMMESKYDHVISQSNNKSKRKSSALAFRNRKGSNSVTMRQRNRRRSQNHCRSSIVIV